MSDDKKRRHRNSYQLDHRFSRADSEWDTEWSEESHRDGKVPMYDLPPQSRQASVKRHEPIKPRKETPVDASVEVALTQDTRGKLEKALESGTKTPRWIKAYVATTSVILLGLATVIGFHVLKEGLVDPGDNGKQTTITNIESRRTDLDDSSQLKKLIAQLRKEIEQIKRVMTAKVTMQDEIQQQPFITPHSNSDASISSAACRLTSHFEIEGTCYAEKIFRAPTVTKSQAFINCFASESQLAQITSAQLQRQLHDVLTARRRKSYKYWVDGERRNNNSRFEFGDGTSAEYLASVVVGDDDDCVQLWIRDTAALVQTDSCFAKLFAHLCQYPRIDNAATDA